MKEIIIILLIFHGIIHLLGYAKSANLKEFDQFSNNISKPIGMMWLLVSMLLIASALGLLVDQNWWSYTTILSIVFSQILIMKYWVDTKTGTIVNVLLLVVLLINYTLQ